MKRAAGILLHPTSLPGRFGIGDLGPGLDRFLDWAQAAGQTLWQTLPLGPPAMAGCPYTCLSAFAGSPMLISPQLLEREGLLEPEDLHDVPDFPTERVDFGPVESWKWSLLRRSWGCFQRRATAGLRADFEAFLGHPDQSFWLEDWAFFSALKGRFPDRVWQEWDAPLAHREPEALEQARRELSDEITYHGYLQFLFHRQWRRARVEARRRGIEVMGDLAIYVSSDSAEVWAKPDLFDLDDEGWPREVAGVPPDYFSTTGQLWGNPLYRWDRIAEQGFRWWIERIAANFRLADRVRIDHFRAFCDYWAVPASDETAQGGRWREGPGIAIFEAIRGALGELPMLVEDLGSIHEGIHELRRATGFPGMRVLQFGFDSATSIHAQHNLEPETVVYTGTHDNDTAMGWYRHLDPSGKKRFKSYSGGQGRRAHWAMIRLAYTSVCELAITPIQDILGLGSEARMNTPGQDGDNWSWRLSEGALEVADPAELRQLAILSGRRAEDNPAEDTEPSP